MAILDILFPQHCVGCRKLGSYICENCFANISFDTNSICLVCGRPSIDGMTHPKCRSKFIIDGSFCAINYKGVVKKLVYTFKYKPYVTDLKDMLSDLFYESLIQKELFIKALAFKPILVPVPLTLSRLKNRGYNQAELLARGLSEKFSLPDVNILERVKATKPQFGLKREERIKNISGAFGINKGVKNFVILSESEESPRNVGSNKSRDPSSRQRRTQDDKLEHSAFLVDDILTTGATLSEAAKILKKNGFAKVWGVSLTRDQ